MLRTKKNAIEASVLPVTPPVGVKLLPSGETELRRMSIALPLLTKPGYVFALAEAPTARRCLAEAVAAHLASLGRKGLGRFHRSQPGAAAGRLCRGRALSRRSLYLRLRGRAQPGRS